MNSQSYSTSLQWREALFVEMFSLLHAHERDNFDVRRYGEEARNAFFFRMHGQYLHFLVTNLEKFFAARSLLADTTSQHLFDQLILFRLLGHMHVRLPTNTPDAAQRLRVPETWKVDDTSDSGMFGPLSIYSVPYAGVNVWVKGWSGNVAATFLSGQYRLERPNISIGPHPGDHIIDGGGCFGDTALAFAVDVGQRGMVYTFDPMPKHCQIISEVCMMNSALAPRIRIFETGLAGSDHVPAVDGGTDMLINPGARLNDSLPTRSIDSLVANGEVDRIDFIKMDIEGSELAALQGAEKSLRRWRPRLAISLYHRVEDFFAVPLWLDSLDCNYSFYLDHYSIHHEETVLYAAADAH